MGLRSWEELCVLLGEPRSLTECKFEPEGQCPFFTFLVLVPFLCARTSSPPLSLPPLPPSPVGLPKTRPPTLFPYNFPSPPPYPSHVFAVWRVGAQHTSHSGKQRCFSASRARDHTLGAALQGSCPSDWNLASHLAWFLGGSPCCFPYKSRVWFYKFGQKKDGVSGMDRERAACTRHHDLLGYYPEPELKGSCQSLGLDPLL